MQDKCPRGSIKNMEAYLQANMLEHSAWSEIAPRNITPCDIDAMVDNSGQILLMELSASSPNWEDYPVGQHEAYRSVVSNGKGVVTMVLMHHVTEKGKPIDTIRDVVAFTVMYYSADDPYSRKNVAYTKTYHGNALWRAFLENWFATMGNLLPMPEGV